MVTRLNIYRPTQKGFHLRHGFSRVLTKYHEVMGIMTNDTIAHGKDSWAKYKHEVSTTAQMSIQLNMVGPFHSMNTYHGAIG